MPSNVTRSPTLMSLVSYMSPPNLSALILRFVTTLAALAATFLAIGDPFHFSSANDYSFATRSSIIGVYEATHWDCL